MADYVSTLRTDTSQHDKALNNAAKSVSNYKKETDKASESINKMKESTSRSTRELMKEMSNMENLGRSTSNYRRQLADIQRQISDLTINYNQMSEAQKQSVLGNEVAQKIDELKQKAAEYKDTIGDVQQEIKNMASDTAAWDAVKQGIQITSSTLQTFAGISGLSADKQEKLLQVINKVKLAETSANAVIQIGNSLQKQSALMIGIRTVQEKAATAARNAETAATGRATIAQKAFNLVAKANPYVLLASAIIGVVGALAIFTKGADKAKAAQEKYNEAINDAREEAGKTAGKFQILITQYAGLQSQAQKQQWIKENRDRFNELGLSVNSINDAEKIFKEHSADIIKSMQLRAEAAAIAANYQEQYAEAYKKSLEIAEGRQQSFMTSNTFRNDWKKAGLQEGVDVEHTSGTWNTSWGAQNWDMYSLTTEGEEKLKKYWEEQGKASLESFTAGAAGMIEDMNNKLAEAESLSGKYMTKGGGAGSNRGDIAALNGSIAKIKSQISEVQKLKDAQVVGTDEWWEQVHALDALNEQLEEAESRAKRLTSNFEPLSPVSNPIVGQVTGPKMKLSGKSPFEKLQEQLEEFEKKYKRTMENVAGYSDILNSVGSIFNSLGANMDENGQAWMNFAGTVAQSVSKILPQLMSLVLGNEAAAMAEGTASSASLPFPANIAAIASIIAELVAVFAAIPKFAEGGIFSGKSGIGDYNIARVNSGEMILNGSQQARLFNMINQGTSNSTSMGTGSVEFKIRGNELVGVLNNYNHKRSKV